MLEGVPVRGLLVWPHELHRDIPVQRGQQLPLAQSGRRLDDGEGEPPADVSLNWPFGESSTGGLLYIKGYENISQLPNLVKGLKGRGWTDPELDKVLGGNWLRVYERVWGA